MKLKVNSFSDELGRRGDGETGRRGDGEHDCHDMTAHDESIYRSILAVTNHEGVSGL